MAFKSKPRKPTTVYNILDVLCATIKIMDDRGGYISKKSSETTGETPTSQFVIQYLKANSPISYSEFSKIAYVREIQCYFNNPPKDINDNFLNTVHTLMITGMVSEKMIGFIVALPWMYENIKNRTTKLIKFAEKYSESNYIGTVGIRDNFVVKLVAVNDFKKKDEQTGKEETLYIFHIADRLGNLGLFFSKLPPQNYNGPNDCLPIEIWECFEMKATPKKMEPNRETGIKETQFSRVSIIEVIGKGTEE